MTSLPPLPLLLAGPILRRVEPGLVTVWVALSRAASVGLTLWEGRVKAGAPSPHARSSPDAATLRVGAHLHITTVTLSIAPTSAKRLRPGQLYAYDITITESTSGKQHNLASLDLLRDGPTRNGSADALAKAHLALGHRDDFLPSFALPPERLEDLQVAYGSCRRLINVHDDAMVWLDDLLLVNDNYDNPTRRPHQLFLGGDQIYADDVSFVHLQVLNRLGKQLIGTVPVPLEHDFQTDTTGSIEHLLVDHAMERVTTTGSFPDGYLPVEGTQRLPADLMNFPAAHRLDLTRKEAQLTSTDGHSHLLSLGEFAAMYVSVWSNACWPDPDDWPVLAEFMPSHERPPMLPQHLTPALRLDQDDKLDERTRAYHREVSDLNRFAAGLPKVRRALANIPTYMVFDDHDV
ncbi:MAG: hypothetical protein RJA98_1436, partial [Pseudomonadota bacterium]